MTNRVICYRPEMNAVWGGTLPNLFVEQVKFWWDAMGRKPFYKFNDKPSKPNQFYKDGDSWQEELCWSRTELESARDAVAVKAAPGDNKRKLLQKHVIVYYRDSKNRLWYIFSEEVYYTKFAEVYSIDQGPEDDPEPAPNDEETGGNGDQPTPRASPPECGHSTFANDDIRQSDNNIDDSHIDNKNKNSDPPTTTKPNWSDGILPDDELSLFTKPSDLRNSRAEWVKLWEKNGFPLISPILGDSMRNLIKKVGWETVKEAIEAAVRRDAKNYAYVERVALNKHQEAKDKAQPETKLPETDSGLLSGKYADEVER